MKSILIILGIVIVVGALILFGRGGEDIPSDQQSEMSGVNENTEKQEKSTTLNEMKGNELEGIDYAPDFKLTKLDGNDITLSEYRGEKAVVLDFFATWCPNCQRSMPKLSKFYEKYGDEIEVIGVNLQENRNTVEKYIDSANIKFPIALDPKKEASRAFGVTYTNYHVLIDRDGAIAGVVPGDISENDIVKLISG